MIREVCAVEFETGSVIPWWDSDGDLNPIPKTPCVTNGDLKTGIRLSFVHRYSLQGSSTPIMQRVT